ncbi:MAG: glycosyltransferase 87 family protein [Actinomycetes bacterium]
MSTRPSTRVTVGIAVVLGQLAFQLRLIPVLRGAGLAGVLGYDDGVYFSASDSLVFGRLPYRDFLFLHPPGVLVALAPFAELARLTTDVRGMAAARLAFMAVGALNAALVYVIARRQGTVAGIVAGLFYAVWGPATYAERTTLLEPLVNLGVLASLVLVASAERAPLASLSRRRVVAAGAVLGLATTVKLWGVVPLVVLAVWVLVRAGRRRFVEYAAGALGSVLIVCLPFFLAAPSQMFRLVVLDQIDRTNNGVSTMRRLVSLTDSHLAPGVVGLGTHPVAVGLAVTAVLASVLVAWRQPATRPWVSLLVAQSAVVLASPSYFGFYAAYVAPALALVVGATAGVVAVWLRDQAPVLLPVGLVATMVALVVVGAGSEAPRYGRSHPGAPLHRALVAARCVTADTSAVLIASDMLTRDLRRGCRVVEDVSGLSYDHQLGRGDLRQGPTVAARRRDPVWQRAVVRYLRGGDAEIVQRRDQIGLTAGSLELIRAHRHVLRDRLYLVLLRPSSGAR